MRYLIEHELALHFAEPVFEHHCEVRLIPSTTPTQRVLSATLTIEPEAHPVAYSDYFGNQIHHFDVPDGHESLLTRARVEVETLLSNPFDYATIAIDRERTWISEALRAQPRLWDFVLHRSVLTPAIESLNEATTPLPSVPADRPVLQAVSEIRDWIAETFKHIAGEDRQLATPAELMEAGEGSAHDLAHLLVTIVRGAGIPVRFVSGYRDCAEDEDDEEEVEPEEQAPRPHAWAEVLIPGAGWRGVDPTTRLIAGDSYVCVAVGRDAQDTVSQRCSFKGSGEGKAPVIAVRVQRQQ